MQFCDSLDEGRQESNAWVSVLAVERIVILLTERRDTKQGYKFERKTVRGKIRVQF